MKMPNNTDQSLYYIFFVDQGAISLKPLGGRPKYAPKLICFFTEKGAPKLY